MRTGVVCVAQKGGPSMCLFPLVSSRRSVPRLFRCSLFQCSAAHMLIAFEETFVRPFTLFRNPSETQLSNQRTLPVASVQQD